MKLPLTIALALVAISGWIAAAYMYVESAEANPYLETARNIKQVLRDDVGNQLGRWCLDYDDAIKKAEDWHAKNRPEHAFLPLARLPECGSTELGKK